MSATLPNLDKLATWLDAELKTYDFRPVPLTETIKINKKILDSDLKMIKNVKSDSLNIDIPVNDI